MTNQVRVTQGSSRESPSNDVLPRTRARYKQILVPPRYFLDRVRNLSEGEQRYIKT